MPTSSIWARSAGRQDHRIVSERDDLPGTGKPRRKTPFGFWTYGSAGRSRDPSKGPRGTGDLGPCRPGPTPAESPLGSASMSVARRREPGGKPKGNRNPSNGRRRRTGERRTTGNQRKAGEGEEPGGQTGNRRKARRGTGGHDVRPQTTRSESGDLGPHASIMTAGMVLAGLREPRLVVHQLTATAVCLPLAHGFLVTRVTGVPGISRPYRGAGSMCQRDEMPAWSRGLSPTHRGGPDPNPERVSHGGDRQVRGV